MRDSDDWKYPSDGQPLQTKVTEHASQVIYDLQAAARGYGLLPEDASERNVSAAYSYLNACRKDVFTYIAELERIAGLPRRVNMRF